MGDDGMGICSDIRFVVGLIDAYLDELLLQIAAIGRDLAGLAVYLAENHFGEIVEIVLCLIVGGRCIFVLNQAIESGA